MPPVYFKRGSSLLRQRRSNRATPAQHMVYFEQVFAELRLHPEKIAIVRRNIAEFQSQPYLKQGLHTAIDRLLLVFEDDDDIELLYRQVMSDDIGQRVRRYPLISKGIISNL
ncbi:hypothetical protein [Shewanella livingstonensis]|uniref:Uncharacterized protein n=1 Tax=Shewanella livingstonensis TaxID=150120 RepID=A0A3G8LZ00_9GAMM|nr:hypothetical protein [Shewanella livingstonensis]AZG73918.1 hypothetical protein EGC82_14820 [Shewanella livingstonensis]